jgi:ectoine hydroxylase-related dioxygenase (phytanoyl-CoA dioxygenase family)
VTADTLRDARRIDVQAQQWSTLSPEEREAHFHVLDREIHDVGIVVVANAITEAQCDEFYELLTHEWDHPIWIERVMRERALAKGPLVVKKVLNLQSRHPAALNLISHPIVMEFFRRFLGKRMVLHSSEGAIVPPGAPDRNQHYDGFDRIPGHFLSMTAVYYLCDADLHNGATNYIPGTHKEHISIKEAGQREKKYVDVKKGDVALFNPYLIHGASANHSNADRPVIVNYYQRSYIKQEFDYPRSITRQQYLQLTPDQRILLGFEHRVPVDVTEWWMVSDNLTDMDPVEGPHRVHRFE